MRLGLEDRSVGGTTRHRAYEALHEAIVSAELEPGRQLSENELADMLGVSRTPVREALVRLQDERLVVIVPQLGTFVTRISPEAVADAAFVREALECAAVRLTAQKADGEGLSQLQSNLGAQDRASAVADPVAFDRLDAALHGLLCELSGHPVAWRLSQRANGHLERIRRLSLREPAYLSEMVREHHAVVAAVAEQDADAAERALREHLRTVPSLQEQIRLEHPEYFEGD